MKRETQPAGPPPEFLNKMARLLPPEEYARFLAAYQQPGRAGLRVNTIKLSAEDFSSISPFPLSAVGAWEPAGFRTDGDARPGRHPYHDAGLYYLQEPSAMLPAALLAPEPGERVLDLAAAPGGKSTQLLSRLTTAGAPGESALRRTLNATGLLVANDVHAARAGILAENITRWGAANSLVLNSEPERLAAALGPIFDRVLVDAPCSGEGMFRRQGGFEWSESIVLACARRQTAILDAAARLVRPGGRLVYSTCTFSPEENEQVIAGFMTGHPEFALVETPRYEGFSSGESGWADSDAPLERAVRLWPQRFPGEGHFAAALIRTSDPGDGPGRIARFAVKSPAAAERSLWRAFATDNLTLELPAERLHAAAGRLYLLPDEPLGLGALRLVRYGLPLGELRSGYFRPAHDLAVALRAKDAVRAVVWSADDPRLVAYLGGRDIDDDGPDGWTLVTVDGFGLGWAKRVGGKLKNHYPRNLRRG